MNKKIVVLISAISVFIFGCSGGGGGGNDNTNTNGNTNTNTNGNANGGGNEISISGVWEGSYTLQSTQQTGETPKGKICLEISDSNTGNIWVSGHVWGAEFTPTLNDNNITAAVQGQNIYGTTENITVNANVEGNQLLGAVIIGSKTYTLNLEKNQTKQNCGWATRDLALAFSTALSTAITQNPNSQNSLAQLLASFITEVPTVDVKVDGNTYQDWWVCIWEVRDNTGSAEHPVYTLGGIVDNQTGFAKWAGWYVDDIGLNNDKTPKAINKALLDIASSANINTAMYVDLISQPQVIFGSDGTGDNYTNDGTTVESEPFYISECSGGKQYKVYMSQIPFSIVFDGVDIRTSDPHSFEAPATGSTETVPALYIEVNNCS